jgi:hypothetical protein
MRRSAALFVLIAAAACQFAPPKPAAAPGAGSAGANKIIVRIKASASNVTSNLEQPADRDVAGFVWIENRSNDTVTVLNLTLHECTNVRLACDAPIAVTLTLVPNARHLALRVPRAASGVPSTFTYAYEWSADGIAHLGAGSPQNPQAAQKNPPSPPETDPVANRTI